MIAAGEKPLLVVNPAAAGGRLGRDWPRLETRLRELGLDADVALTRAPGHATDITAEAATQGRELVVAVGGDGTTDEVIQGLRQAGRGALGILPLGTGNDAAAGVGIPLDLESATRALLEGFRRRADLMQIGDHAVLNAIGIGLLGDINLRAVRLKKVRGFAGYLVAATASLFGFSTPEVTLKTPSSEYHGPMTILALHGGPTTGGGFALAPGADPFDGQLDACLVTELAGLKRPARLIAALRGTLNRAPEARLLRDPWLELEFDEPLACHLDGNATVLQPPTVRIEVVPGALEVVVPAPSFFDQGS